MTSHSQSGTRRLQATILGIGFDGDVGPKRVLKSQEFLMIGGSEETHAELLETVLRLESELERLGRRLGDLQPEELAELAWRIDSPELHEIAVRMHDGLVETGRTFAESSPEELTELASPSGHDY